MKLFLSLSFTCLFLLSQAYSQALDPTDTLMGFEEYVPVPTLVVPQHPTQQSKFPFIDVHNHQFRMGKMDLSTLTADMDKLNMAVMVNLSGRGFGDPKTLEENLDNATKNAPGRFIVFTNIRFEGIDDPEWGELTAKQIENDVKRGANGLKIYKNLGLTSKDKDGKRIAVDDPRIDPVWAMCGKLGIPVLIHTGEPAPFWKPRDKFNERWLELKQRPGRYRDPEVYPSWENIMAEQHRMFKKHPNTKFINAHLGWFGNDLTKLGELMDEIPNMYTEIGAVLAELGRQPRAARAFFTKYQDRVMFGKDSWRPEEYYVYFRVLETNDEYFDYYRKRHAFWKMYGLGLSDDILKKIYYKNALKVIPNIDASHFPE